jgi:hypothetical protein
MTKMIVRKGRSSCPHHRKPGTGDKTHCSKCAEMTACIEKSSGAKKHQA